MEELKKYGSRNLNQRHEDQFVRWFEGKIRDLYAKGEVSSEMFALAQGPDSRARTLHRCHINNWLFRTIAQWCACQGRRYYWQHELVWGD